MRIGALAVAVLLFTVGCQTYSEPEVSGAGRQSMFAPSAMRIHPIFTQVKSWTVGGRPNGIEALLEFQDAFGDPTKASGRVVFELYEFRTGNPDPRGRRLVNPWIGSIQTLEQQQAHWNRTSRTYGFQLAFDGVRLDRAYVLTAMFELDGGGRFFDRMVLEPPPATTPQR